jgi:hypothetical protein
VEGEGGSCESRLVLSVVEVGLLVLFPTSCDGNYMSEITWVKFGEALGLQFCDSPGRLRSSECT